MIISAAKTPNSTPTSSTASTPGIAHAESVLNTSWDQLKRPAAGTNIPLFSDISVTPDQLLRLIGSLDDTLINRSDVLPVCLSDFDGTLTSGASGSKIFEYGIASGFFLESVRSKINETLEFFSISPQPSDSVGEEFSRILKTFRAWSQDSDISPEHKEEGTRLIYKMLSWIYAGHTREEVHAFAEKAFRAIGYDQLYLQGAEELVRQLSRKGIATAIVSVKFQPILEVAARHFGIPDSAVAGMNLELDESGRFTTEIKPPITFREGKDAAARNLLVPFRRGRAEEARPLFAMGDSPAKSDQQMLEMAHIALFTEPQTPRDAEYARAQIVAGRRAIIVDYETTVDGEAMTLFDRSTETQTGPKGRFL